MNFQIVEIIYLVSDLFAHSQYICRSVFFVLNLFALRKIRNIDELLKALEAKYLLAEGLMVSTANKKILLGVLNELKLLYDELMLKCLPLREGDYLPNTKTTKLSVVNDKSEFNARVNEWIDSAESCSSVRSNLERNDRLKIDKDSESQSTCTSRSRRSSSSATSQKIRESLVKLRLATYAREMQYKRSRQEELAEKTLQERERVLQEAEREFKRVQSALKQDALNREKEYNALLAAVEAEAWKEVASERGSVKDVNDICTTADVSNHRGVLKGPESADRTRCGEVTGSGNAHAVLSGYSSDQPPRPSPEPVPTPIVCNEGRVDVKGVLHSVKRGVRSDLAPSELTYNNHHACRSTNVIETYNSIRECHKNKQAIPQTSTSKLETGGLRPLLQTEFSVTNSTSQSGGAYPVVNHRVVPVVQDYPPPKPVIPRFDGDPLTFWTFIRSFDTHIAEKMPNDAARLVYLLQHCSEKVRHSPEHFSRDNTTGYRLARESLFNEYVQPHTIAYCCEQKLLNSQRLKSKEPCGLRDLAILMEKCLGIMEDIGDFATLNSFGTIQRITDKFLEETQREWVRWAFRVLKDTGQQAKFKELVEFVRHESDEANSLYGRSFFSLSKPPNSLPAPKKSAAFGTVVSRQEVKRTESEPRVPCPFCKGRHSLVSCKGFQDMSRYKRIEFLRKQGRCFRCLQKSHFISDCQSKITCEVVGCYSALHHTVLHKYAPSDAPGVSSTASASGSEVSERVLCSTLCGSTRSKSKNGLYFMTIPVKVSCGSTMVTTYALLDSGSQRTFCEINLAQKLGAIGPKEVLSIQTLTSGNGSTVVEGMLISLSVESLLNEEIVNLNGVLTVDRIPLKAGVAPTALELEKMKHLKGVVLHELRDKTVSLLIGLDNFSLFRPLENRCGAEGEPDAVLTVLGWTLFGTISSPQDGIKSCMHVSTLHDEGVCLERAPHDFVLSCGLECDNSKEDRVAFELMQNSVKIVDGHFQLPLLWRNKSVKLPNNLLVAKNRLESLKRRLTKDPQLHQCYTETMQMYIDRGYAEQVFDCADNDRTWFLPHHPVLNPNKPGKIRIVFDCASSCMGVSLNDALMQGPQLMNNLVGVLIRFRLENIALVADIEAMFHQVSVEPGDRSALQFLWWPAGNVDEDPQVFRMTVHLFGATSSPSCASFCLKQVSKICYDECSARTREIINKAFYVDDCLTSVPSHEETVEVIAELRRVLSRCGFNLTKWVSNSEVALASVPQENRAEAVRSLNLEGSLKERVLGVQWEVAFDQLCVRIKIPSKPYTRRGILSMSHSIFDPLGMVAPVLIEPKLLLRELCDYGWDDVIYEDKVKRWQAWLYSLNHL